MGGFQDVVNIKRGRFADPFCFTGRFDFCQILRRRKMFHNFKARKSRVQQVSYKIAIFSDIVVKIHLFD